MIFDWLIKGAGLFLILELNSDKQPNNLIKNLGTGMLIKRLGFLLNTVRFSAQY